MAACHKSCVTHDGLEACGACVSSRDTVTRLEKAIREGEYRRTHAGNATADLLRDKERTGEDRFRLCSINSSSVSMEENRNEGGVGGKQTGREWRQIHGKTENGRVIEKRNLSQGALSQ